jgi:hypothetical protein
MTASIGEAEILGRFAVAVKALLADKGYQYANPGEQAVTGKLSNLMEPNFSEWSVCPEWNRKNQEEKMLHYGLEGEVAKLRSIRPDIIVHRIGQDDNVLVVEAKRVENRNDAGDKAKLRAMTDPGGGYSYQVGVHLVIDMKQAAIAACEVFVAGAPHANLTAALRGMLP